MRPLRGIQRTGGAALAVALCVGLPRPAAAELFSRTNLQLLYGFGFHDPAADTDTVDGALATVRFEHFGTWSRGDNYLFVNAYEGDFISANGAPGGYGTRIFLKWVTRLSLGRLAGDGDGLGFLFVRDVFVSARLERDGAGFYANLVGASMDFSLPEGAFAGLGVYLRKDRYNGVTLQLSPFWYVPVAVRTVRLLFAGYLDAWGTDDVGLELYAEPQALLDVGALAVGVEGRVHLGLAWAIHLTDRVTTSAPQAALRWTW